MTVASWPSLLQGTCAPGINRQREVCRPAPADRSPDVPYSSQSRVVAAGAGLLPSGSPSPFGCKTSDICYNPCLVKARDIIRQDTVTAFLPKPVHRTHFMLHHL